AKEGHWQVANLRASEYGKPRWIEWLALQPGKLQKLPLHGLPSLAEKGFVQTFWLRRNLSESLIGGIYYGRRSPLGFGVLGPVHFARGQDGRAIRIEIDDTSEELALKKEVLLLGSNQYAKGLTFIFTFSGG